MFTVESVQRILREASQAKGSKTMSNQNDKPVEGDEEVAHLDSQDLPTADDTHTANPQEEVVEDNTVTIRMSQRAARIGALVLAGFVGLIIGIVGTSFAHHIHDGRHDRGPGHMRFEDGRMGPGQYGPGMGMMRDGQMAPGFGPHGQRGHDMMPGGPGFGDTVPTQPGIPAPAESTK